MCTTAHGLAAVYLEAAEIDSDRTRPSSSVSVNIRIWASGVRSCRPAGVLQLER
jgi:hypothetical protein